MNRRLWMAGMVGSVVSVPQWATGQSPISRRIPTRTGLAQLGLERHWFSVVPLAGGSARVAGMNLAGRNGEYLFVQTTDAIVACYRSETGQRLWTVQLPGMTLHPAAISVNSTMAVASVGQRVYGLELGSGAIAWQAKLEDLAAGGTAMNEEFAAAALNNGKVMIFNLKHPGEDVCGKTHDPDNCALLKPSVGSYLYAWQTNKSVTSRPIMTDKFLAFASQDGKVYMASLEDRKILHRVSTKGPIKGHLGTYGQSQLLVGSEDHKIYCIDLFEPENPDTNWVFPTPAPVDRGILVAGDDAYTVTREGELYAIDARNGVEKWHLNVGRGRMVAVTPTRIYGISVEGGMAVVNRADGRVEVTPDQAIQSYGVDLKNYPARMGNDFNDRIYMASADGILLCLRELGKVAPTSLRDPKLPPFGMTPEDLDELNAAEKTDD